VALSTNTVSARAASCAPCLDTPGHLKVMPSQRTGAEIQLPGLGILAGLLGWESWLHASFLLSLPLLLLHPRSPLPPPRPD
jgi:hypothetical protein